MSPPLIITSRTKQETDLSWDAGAPRARVFATRGLRDRKALDSPVVLKKVLAKSNRRKKVTSVLIFLSGGHGPDRNQKSLDFGHLPVVNSKREPNFGNFPSLTVRADFDADWCI